MDEHEQPCPGPLSADTSDPDAEWAEYVAWLDRERAADREVGPVFQVPEDDEPENPESWEPWRPRFGQGDEADVLPPSPLLAQLTEDAVLCLSCLSDDELVGVLQATRRQIAREQYKQVLVIAEFGRRRQAAFEDAARHGVPVGCRPGGFPGEELAIELVATRAEAGHRIDDAVDLTSRLPLTLAGMAAGRIDEARAGWIAMYTRSLTPADAAAADAILAAAAPDLRVDQVAHKALALEKKLAPEAVKARKEHAKQTGQRIEARREASGNASLAGREMDTADVMASKAYLDAVAARLRDGGVPGSIGALRVLALSDLTQGRNPLDRLIPASTAPLPQDPTAPLSQDPAASQQDPDSWPGWGSCDNDDPDDDADDSLADERGGPGCGPFTRQGRRSPVPAPQGRPSPVPAPQGRPSPVPAPQGRPSPVPAQVNLIVPVGTLLGWSTAPGQAGGWGLLDRDETRAVIDAAARHPATRWCATLTGPDGTALAHACAAGRHPRLLSDLAPQPPPAQIAELLSRLNLTFTPVARGTCDHAQAEDRYAPSRKLRHLVRARTATCDAPGCQAQAINADLDHTAPYPQGSTCQCNLAPRCRAHHRAKQAPDWRVEQTEPGVTRWTLPSGRTHTTAPTRYDT